MKFKKLLAILMVASSLTVLASSPSAFASDYGTTSVGVGDTQAQALDLIPGVSFTHFLSSPTDEDWFKYTNKSGKFQQLNTHVQPNNGESNFRFGFKYKYRTASNYDYESDMVYAGFLNSYSAQLIQAIIPPGATAYFKVDSTKFGGSQYTIGLHSSDL
ncbi:hypothetical protein [Paenibacillus sp. 481]|uniref:hypothetical protein n=1 Tax=Paenibacillus sp. 481 TaxID=2835869 RepID=UPI001E2C54CA|nr:hypothetical protein [Paenibacillus sp. 481]UHA73081.1 hypothetical protein KIK04_21185 [Paenibacillus sp. 481]